MKDLPGLAGANSLKLLLLLQLLQILIPLSPCLVDDDKQCVLVPRRIGELELDFENPSCKSNWDLKEFTVNFTVKKHNKIMGF